MCATKGKEKQKVETVKTKGFDWKDFEFGLYGEVKYIRSGLYGGDRAENYFIFINILKLIKTILKLLDKFKKDDENDMTADVA